MFESDVSASAVLGGPAETTQDGGGAPPSNTAPPNCNLGNEDGDFRLLRCAIDSLYLSYRGTVALPWYNKLEALKGFAKDEDPTVRCQAQVSIHQHLFEVGPFGRGKFKYVLTDNWFGVHIAGPRARKLPMAHVQVSSELLTCMGLDFVLADLRPILGALGLVEGEPSISRVDLCVDFVNQADVSTVAPRDWVTRAEHVDAHYVGRQFSGYSIGKGGSLVARLYDKTLETLKSRKDYLRALWADAGWQDGETVWRLEFQLRREALRSLKIAQVDDLIRQLGALWRYCTTDWLRLTLPNPNDETRARWPSHPLWSAIQGVDWDGADAPALYPVRRSRVPADDYLFRNGLGALTSFMAREGISDLAEGLGAYLAAMDDYHAQHGKGSAEYVRRKVLDKGQRFNTIDNRKTDVAELLDAAEAYRKGRDGE